MRYCLKMEFYADITVFDAGTIQDNANLETPYQYVTGIPHVFIIGTQAVKNGDIRVHIQEKWSEAQDGMENNNQKNEINYQSVFDLANDVHCCA